MHSPNVEFYRDGDMLFEIKVKQVADSKKCIIELFNRRTGEMAIFDAHTFDYIISKIKHLSSKVRPVAACAATKEEVCGNLDELYQTVDLTESSNRKPLVRYIRNGDLYNVKYLWNDLMLTKREVEAVYDAQVIAEEFQCYHDIFNYPHTSYCAHCMWGKGCVYY